MGFLSLGSNAIRWDDRRPPPIRAGQEASTREGGSLQVKQTDPHARLTWLGHKAQNRFQGWVRVLLINKEVGQVQGKSGEMR